MKLFSLVIMASLIGSGQSGFFYSWNHHMTALRRLVWLADASARRCDPGWSYLYASDKCIKLFTKEKQWLKAMWNCKDHVGDLLMIRNQEERQEVFKLIRDMEPIWIGRSRYRYVRYKLGIMDGPKPLTTFWAVGEPNKTHGNCVQSTPGTPRDDWKVKNCNMKLRHVCEKKPYPDPGDKCEKGWFYSHTGEKCLKVIATPQTWHEARSNCQNLSGDLFMMRNKEERQLARTLIPTIIKTYFWIGVVDRLQNGNFEFVDGSKVRHVYWSWNQPEKTGDHCVVDYSIFGMWKVKGCRSLFGSLCEKPTIPESTSTGKRLILDKTTDV